MASHPSHSRSTPAKNTPVSYDPIPAVARRIKQRRIPTPREWIVWGSIIGLVFALWLTWFLVTRPVRDEFHRVERYLDTLPRVRDAHLDIPWFAHTLPDVVDLRATGLPEHGYAYEVTIELKGSYDTHTRVATLKGVKQVLMPYEKIVIDRKEAVPPP